MKTGVDAMRLIKGWALVLATGFLVSCGGGGKSGGTDSTTGPTAADLSLVLSDTSLVDTGTATIKATVTAVDASRNALSDIPVTIGVDNNAVAVVSGSATDSSGKVTADISIGNDKSNRIVTVTARSGSLVRTASFAITGAKLQATVLQQVIAPGAAGQIQYRLVDNSGNPIAGAAINVSAPGLTSADGTTDATGSFNFNYTAPNTAGATITVTATGGGAAPNVQDIIVQGTSGAIPPVSAAIQSASVSANPSVVNINADTSTNNRTEIRALFLGAGNAPIKNVRVRFDLNGDVNSIGGTLASGTNVVYSDANGIASTFYVPGSRSSPTNGVTVRACYYSDDAAANAGGCATNALTTLTVVSDPLAVTIGTDNKIEEGAGGLTYIKKYVVLVVDSSGQAKADVQITPSIDLLSYTKGFYGNPGGWTRQPPSGFTGVTCPNEDSNRNGVLEANEDINRNGQLDPRKSDVAISMIGSNKTNGSGIATLQIEYPKNVATWVTFKILISASGIAGTEGRTTWTGVLPADAESFKSDTPPAFQRSPYGAGTTDSNGNGSLDCGDWD
jgi:hypothetical protein